jgi:hypothetical protein
VRPECGRRNLVWMLRASGAHWYCWFDCGTWSCDACAHEKFVAIAENLIGHADKGYRVAVPRARVVGVRRSITGTSSLRLSLAGGGLYVVCDRETSGYGWATELVDTDEEVAEVLAAWPHSRPTRTTWTGAWVPPVPVVTDDDPVVYRQHFAGNAEMRAVLARVGVDPRREDRPVADPYAVAARLREVASETDPRTLLG